MMIQVIIFIYVVPAPLCEQQSEPMQGSGHPKDEASLYSILLFYRTKKSIPEFAAHP
jgi:hypothetical protein